MDIALHYGAMLRECIRHQSIARYVLESEHMKKFFDYIQLPNFDIASDASATFKELLTRHKATVAEFLSNNYDWVSIFTLGRLFKFISFTMNLYPSSCCICSNYIWS
ncbi:Putative MO25-like protein [Zea mays]|uniref:Putative MO25-like protein n=1 Tax=Zea mays TaxID=4577 RepID=A0A1D6EZS3_MAIZE|nr:Putative MO25-like protein [Zea mays]